MKFKVIKKILSSLVLVAIISTICGNVSALPEFPEKYVQNFVKTLQADFDNGFTSNEARKIWEEKYSKANVSDALNELNDCACVLGIEQEVAYAIERMKAYGLLRDLKLEEAVLVIKTLLTCLQSENAKNLAGRTILDIIDSGLLKGLSLDQVFEIIENSKDNDYFVSIVKKMVNQHLLKNLSWEQVQDLIKMVLNQPSYGNNDVRCLIDDMLSEGLLSGFSAEQILDLIKISSQYLKNDCYEARYVAGQICDMAKKHLLKGFSSEQTLWIIDILGFCSKHTIDDEIKAQEEKCGYFSNMSYINANKSGFSNGDVARSNAQEAIKEMVGDGLFDGFNPDQILAVAKVLNSCLKFEVSDSKSDMPVADSIKLMAQRKLFDSLTESQIKVILDILHKCATDGCVAKCSVKPAVKSILESKAKCLTPEVESICEDILRKCKDGCDTLGYQGYYWKGKSVFNPYFDCQP